MHATVRVYRNLRDFDEIARRVETSLVPVLQAISGFRGYYAIRCGDTVGVSVSLFDSEEAARHSSDKGAAWGREHLAELSGGQPPEMLSGEVLVAVAE